MPCDSFRNKVSRAQFIHIFKADMVHHNFSPPHSNFTLKFEGKSPKTHDFLYDAFFFGIILRCFDFDFFYNVKDVIDFFSKDKKFWKFAFKESKRSTF